ncbi:MAG: lipocalin-like domain-containing protein [Bacteroidaceae bacterium]|nr:lipocalin-like domain-containing protein [Bacteroidaceae bacterium]
MRKQIYTIMTLFALVLTSCESYLVNGDLDGFWQVKSIEDKQTGDITRCKGDIYYSFQRDLVLVSCTLSSNPTGQMKENYIAYFTHENDTIKMTDFRIYLDRDGKQALLQNLEKFGLYELYNVFHVEELTGKSLVLDSEKAHIILKKY